MSARAAWRLETLGFTQVYRYVPGKANWMATGLPFEGSQARVPRALAVARREVPTCRLGERVGDVRDRVRQAGWDTCLVVADDDVVLGRLRQPQLDADPAAAVDDVMENGPTTIRPDAALDTLVPHLKERRVGTIVVTLPDGRLVGLLDRDDAQRRLEEFQAGEGRRAQSSQSGRR